MQFSTNINAFRDIKTGCLVVGVYEEQMRSTEAFDIDDEGVILDIMTNGDLSGKVGSSYVYRPRSGNAERILVVGLGKHEPITVKTYEKVIATIAGVFETLGAKDAVLALPFDKLKDRDIPYAVKTAVSTLRYHQYVFDRFKSTKEERKGVQHVIFPMFLDVDSSSKSAIKEAEALADGIDLTRNLGNTPSNYCTPNHLATTAHKISGEYGLDVTVLGRREIEKLGMDSFLAVAQGSVHEPQLIVIKYLKGEQDGKPTVLVGKGITFDSGGISIKPSSGMEDMKYDMSGAGTVLGVMKAVAGMNLPINLIGVIPACENMPSGTAIKPGDIVTSMSGTTIEIINTDAEGRLILCDTLTFVERFKPEVVIDMATLTGACIGALGDHNTGLFTRSDDTHDALADALLAAGKEANDTAWRLPLDERYDEQISSTFADIANIGSPGAGASTAACFLERFTRNYTWAHLDIAGTANNSSGATGRPIPLLVQFLQSRVAN